MIKNLKLYLSLLLLLFYTIESSKISSPPPPSIPSFTLDFTNIKTPQLIGIIIGVCVFTVTIGTVFYLLIASGTLSNALREIAEDANKKSSNTKSSNSTSIITASSIKDSPIQSSFELYDYLLDARKKLSKKFQFNESIKGHRIKLHTLHQIKDEKELEQMFIYLHEASNGSPQYNESQYNPYLRVWGWMDIDIEKETNKDNNKQEVEDDKKKNKKNKKNNESNTNNIDDDDEDLRQPWKSLKDLKKFYDINSNDSHIIIEDLEYNKPIGVVSITNNDTRNLSLELTNFWFTPAFEGQIQFTEAFYYLLKYIFESGYRRVTYYTDSRNEYMKKFLTNLTFLNEGILVKHRIIQNRNSNSNIFTLLNSDWQVDGEAKIKKYLKIPEPYKAKAIDIIVPDFEELGKKAKEIEKKEKKKNKKKNL